MSFLGKTIRVTVLLGIFCGASAGVLAQQTLYWDPTGKHNSNGGGSGTWDTGTTANWWISGPTDSTWTDTVGTDMAVFGGAAGTYTVNVSGNNTANGLTFSTAGYTLSNGTVTMAGGSPTITPNAPATIASVFTVGTDGATFSGTSSVTLTQPFIPVATDSNPSSVQISSGTVTVIGNTTQYPPYPATPIPGGSVTVGADCPINLSAGAVLRTAYTLNLLTAQEPGGHAEDITGLGTIQLVGTAGSYANPDINFGPDYIGNNYDGVLIGSQNDITNGAIGLTLNLGNRQRYIIGNTGHNSVSDYYGTSTAPDCQIIANIIGSGGISYYANEQYGGLWPELVLSGSNTFTGPVEVDRGAIFLDNVAALSQSNTFTLSNSDKPGASYSRLFLFGNNATVTNLQSIGTAANIGIANGNPVMKNGSQMASSVDPATLTVNETANTTFAGVIADALTDFHDGGSIVPGPLSLVKTGSGSLTLTGINTYTGGTTLSAGILGFSGSGLGTGPITLSGDSGLRWYNNSNDLFTTNALQIGDNSNITLDTNGNNVTLSGALSMGDSGSLIKAGPGALVLTGPVSYGGGTTVEGGSIRFSSSASFPATGLITLTGGAVQVTGPYTTVAAWLASNRIDPASTGALALTADSSENINMAGYPTLSLGAATGATVNYTGTLTPANPGTWYLGGGGGHITFPKLVLTGTVNAVLGSGDRGGSGTLTFPDSADPTKTNTYTGTTTINGGLVVTPVLANGGMPSTIGESSSSESNLILNGGGIQYSGSGASTDRVFSLGVYGGVLDASGTGPMQWTSTATIGFAGGSGPRTLTLQGSNTGANTLALAIADNGGPTSLVMNGPGNWLVTGANTYQGGTTINGGNLTFSQKSAMPASGSVSVAAGATVGLVVGATPTYFGAVDLDAAFAGTTPNLTVAPGGYVGIDTTQGNFTYTPGFGSSSIGLNKLGNNTLTLVGSNSQYTGQPIVTAGTLQLGDGTTDFAPLTGNIVNNSTLVYNRKNNQTYSGAISGAGNLAKTGPATLTLNGVQSYGGATLITGGVLKVPQISPPINGFNGGANWTVNSINVTSPAFPDTNTAQVTDSNGNQWRTVFNNTPVPVNFAFTTTFTYQGVGSADGASFILQNSSSGANAISNSNGGSSLAVDLIQPSVGMAINIYTGHNATGTNWMVNGTTIAPGSFNVAAGPAPTSYNATGDVDFTSGDPITFQLTYDGSKYLTENLTDLTTSGTYSATYTVGNLAQQLNGPIAYLGFSGACGGASSTQTFSDFSLVYNSGPELPSLTPMTISNGGSFDMTNASVMIGSLASTDGKGSTVLLGSGTLTVGGNNTTTTFDGSIQGVGGVLDKVGSGALVLTGSDTYTGGTTVNAGSLVVTSNAALPGGTNLTIGPGGTFVFDPSRASATPVSAGTVAVPEPGTLGLLAVAGLMVFAAWRHRRN